MRHFLTFLVIIPFALHAQLDRIKLDMSEAEFRKAIPEATRNLEAESGWIEDTGSVSSINGKMRWRIYNDSIEAFYFTSQTVQGPSEQFPGVDSSAVHDLKVKAEGLRVALEMTHGKPDKIVNECLSCATMMDNPFVYFVQWILPGNGSVVLAVSIDQYFNNQINAAYTPVRKSETYELFLQVTATSLLLKSRYDMGRSATEFLQLHPEYEAQALFVHNHTYNFKDTATSDYSSWQYIFIDEELTYMEYNSWLGSNYGDNDIAAFHVGKKKSTQLLDEAKVLHGRPSSLENDTPKEYTVHTDFLSYRKDYLVAEWKEKEGVATMEFEEYGGGKHGGTTFHIQYVFERGKQQ